MASDDKYIYTMYKEIEKHLLELAKKAENGIINWGMDQEIWQEIWYMHSSLHLLCCI